MIRFLFASLGTLLFFGLTPEDQKVSVSAPSASQSSVASHQRYSILFTQVIGSDSISLPSDEDGYLVLARTDRSLSPVSVRVHKSNDSVKSTSWKVLQPTSRRNHALTQTTKSLPRRVLAEPSIARKTRSFALHVTEGSLSDAKNYTTIQAKMIAESRHLRIYLDQQRTSSARIQTLADEIIQSMEEQVLPEAIRTFGDWADIDSDGKLTILLTPWLSRLQGGNTSVKGFVRGSDYNGSPHPFGNKADMIYFNSELSQTENVQTLLAHEYFHVLQFSMRLAGSTSLPIEEDWLSEGQAHLAENRFGGDASNLQHRIEAFLNSPEDSPLVVENYYSSGLWRHDECRGATYLFLRWCEDQFGQQMLEELVRSPLRGVSSLELATGNSFENLYRNWLASLLGERSPYLFDWQNHGFREPDFRKLMGQRLGLETTPIIAIELRGSSFSVIEINENSPRNLHMEAPADCSFELIWIPSQKSRDIIALNEKQLTE